uniref:AlNc14C1459G12950 protein n=1 Tax=Albugo laibachii Nc14 TaxID=890382 RepID=F0X2Q2_9STRA|nr:AlNc14C1459G12950 [Albugo laibachii Nc14]|eukprot:CCA28184.1 AlNc14C1459G12950 [Albugo laibachii Nc14]
MSRILWIFILRSAYGCNSKDLTLDHKIALDGNISTLELTQYALDERYTEHILRSASHHCNPESHCVERVDYILHERERRHIFMEKRKKEEFQQKDIATEENAIEFESFFRRYAATWTPVLMESGNTSLFGNFHRETSYFMDL